METKDADQSKERAGITKKSSYAKHIGIEVVSSAWNQLLSDPGKRNGFYDASVQGVFIESGPKPSQKRKRSALDLMKEAK